MNVLLVAMAAKYVHKSLAVRSIRAYLQAQGLAAEVLEFTTAQETMRIAAEVVRKKADVIGFSCYIWNAEKILALAEIVKKAAPQTMIVLGGPEVAYMPKAILARCPFADAVMCGENEETYAALLRGEREIPGLVCRGGAVSKAAPMDLAKIPFPYTAEELAEKEAIFYYESSRGCPYRCAYCLSAAETGVRYKPLEMVEQDFKTFADYDVRLVKLVDRTFNSDDERAQKILDIIARLGGRTEFHFEVSADILSRALMDKLVQLPAGKVRLEVGLQSVHEKTLRAVDRPCRVEQIAQNLAYIGRNGTVEVHLDLIAGLPHETFADFRSSFDRAMAMQANELQLGFLKILPGTPLAQRTAQYGYAWSEKPPYEVVKSNDISFEELAQLKEIEEVVDVFWNQGAFVRLRRLLEKKIDSVFDLCQKIAKYMARQGWLSAPHRRAQRFEQIVSFLQDAGIWVEEMRHAAVQDFLVDCPDVQLPAWAADWRKARLRLTEVLQMPDITATIKPNGEKKMWHRRYSLWENQDGIWLVDKTAKEVWNITAYF
ncbi:MAG: B12-binding domain-containing radical SAM protein [Clostridia bacterium]|nr:B12-binding domain-containing radical SAM protein [Clostridia bacterium]